MEIEQDLGKIEDMETEQIEEIEIVEEMEKIDEIGEDIEKIGGDEADKGRRSGTRPSGLRLNVDVLIPLIRRSLESSPHGRGIHQQNRTPCRKHSGGGSGGGGSSSNAAAAAAPHSATSMPSGGKEGLREASSVRRAASEQCGAPLIWRGGRYNRRGEAP
ncbi:unnamed protein product [Merluccius merluccius]